MDKKINVKKQNKLFKLNTVVIVCTIITLILGIADMVLDILHTKDSPLATAFLILGIVMSVPGLTWLISSIVLLVKDKGKVINGKLKVAMIVVLAISFATFIPLWIEGFLEGNRMPMFERVMYRQVIWMIVWIIYLSTNIATCLITYTFRCKYLYSK